MTDWGITEMETECARDALRIAREPDTIKRLRIALGLIAQMTALYPDGVYVRPFVNLLTQAALHPDATRLRTVQQTIGNGLYAKLSTEVRARDNGHPQHYGVQEWNPTYHKPARDLGS